MTPLKLVEGQLAAYNQRDLEGFCIFFSDDIIVRDGRTLDILFQGMAEFRERYLSTFNNERLHCRLMQRIVQDDIVIDHENVTGMGEDIVSAVAVYRCASDKIQEVTFY